MTSPLRFPTALHQQTAEIARGFFAGRPHVDTVLVVNSCARGVATPESDLDMAVLAHQIPELDLRALESEWTSFAASDPVIGRFRQAGHFSHLHLDVITADYQPTVWDEGGGPDSFEMQIGNQVAYGQPLGERGPYYEQLRATWLPYYDEPLRETRQAMVRHACAYDLDHVPWYVSRGLYFQAFDRLYKAFGEFLQALFIARRVYPLAYNKWIREQVEGWLGLPEVYEQLPGVLSVSRLDSAELVDRAAGLRALLDTWT